MGIREEVGQGVRGEDRVMIVRVRWTVLERVEGGNKVGISSGG